MRYLLLLMCSISLQADWKDWDNSNKELFKKYIYLNTIDVHMTYTYTNTYNNVVEVNPFLNKKPSLEKLLLAKTLSAYGFYKILDAESAYTKRKSLEVVNAFYIGVVIHNGYIGFDLRKQF